MRSGQGSIRLFRFSGIDVFLHWSWFVVAIYEIQGRTGSYSSVTWNVLEYLGAVPDRSTARVRTRPGLPPGRRKCEPDRALASRRRRLRRPATRPGATLWSIAAGPLVNVVLVPLLGYLAVLTHSPLWTAGRPNFYEFIPSLFWINVGLLVFNILPIYPLDGGQILRSLLWFVLGRARSLMVATVLGLIGVAGFIALASGSKISGSGRSPSSC